MQCDYNIIIKIHNNKKKKTMKTSEQIVERMKAQMEVIFEFEGGNEVFRNFFYLLEFSVGKEDAVEFVRELKVKYDR